MTPAEPHRRATPVEINRARASLARLDQGQLMLMLDAYLARRFGPRLAATMAMSIATQIQAQDWPIKPTQPERTHDAIRPTL